MDDFWDRDRMVKLKPEVAAKAGKEWVTFDELLSILFREAVTEMTESNIDRYLRERYPLVKVGGQHVE